MKQCARCKALKDEASIKYCSRCRKGAPLVQFSKDTRRKDGRKSYCKECERISKARQRAVNRESIAKSNAAYWKRNKKRINHRRRIIYKIKPLAGTMPAWKVGEVLNKSTSWVNELAQQVGISLSYIKVRWSKRDERLLLNLRSKGVTIKECAAILKRSIESVKYKLRNP